jgi:hydroxymethylglutaryl-CoA lyase
MMAAFLLMRSSRSPPSLRKVGRKCARDIAPRLQFSQRLYSSSTHGVRIVEVGPRDGLQNIKRSIPTATKIELIQRLAGTGLRDIEATSFVSPKWVPQLADGAEVMKDVLRLGNLQRELRFPVLAPNLKGLENAHKAGAKEIVVFASVTEAFSKANQNCSVEEALAQAEAVTREALKLGIMVRGSVYLEWQCHVCMGSH